MRQIHDDDIVTQQCQVKKKRANVEKRNINTVSTDRSLQRAHSLDKAVHLDAVESICVGKLQMACEVNQVCQSLLLPHSISEGQMLAEGTKSSIRVRRAAALKRHLLLLLSEIISSHLFISFSCGTQEPYGGK